MTESTFPEQAGQADTARPPGVVLMPLCVGTQHPVSAALVQQFAHAGWDVAVYYNAPDKPSPPAGSGDSNDDLQTPDQAIQALRENVSCAGRRFAVFSVRWSGWSKRLLASDARALIDGCTQQLGRPDCLVTLPVLPPAGAADASEGAEMPEMAALQPDTLAEMVQYNLAWPLALSEALFQRWQGHMDGRSDFPVVIQVSDTMQRGGLPGTLPFDMTQTALQSSVPALARAYAPTLRVVGVATLLFDRHRARAFGVNDVAVARAVHYLAQAETITGSVLWADGGERHAAPQACSV